MRRRTHTEGRLRSDARSFRLTPPNSLTPRPTHTQADSYPDAFASRLPRTEPLRLPPPRAEAHSHRVTWTPLGATSAEGTRQPPSKYLQHSGRPLGLHWDPDRLSCRSGRGVGNPELLKAPGGVFARPRRVSTGKKNAKLKSRTGAKARERAFFGAATPVRARGQGFREWGGNSNLKRNLSPSESDGLRFPLKIQFWVLWR